MTDVIPSNLQAANTIERASEGATRDPSLDVARGALLAYVIIFIHGLFWLGLCPFLPASAFLFEMPLIFMISGAAFFLSERGRASGTNPIASYGAYLYRRGARILIPYWGYTLVSAALVVVLTGAPVFETLIIWLSPWTYGLDHKWLKLNAHLWFVTPFLGVMALMPMLKALRIDAAPPLWALALFGALVVQGADLLDSSELGHIQQVVFYSLWAAFGYLIAANPVRYGVRDYASVVFPAVAYLACALFLPEHVSLNMQANKFPPNLAFFAFSCVWVALLVLASRFVDHRLVAQMARSALLRPFIRSGYSLYLWQGLGYSAAIYAGETFDWPPLLIWPIAILLTLAFGLLAAPLERVRLRA